MSPAEGQGEIGVGQADQIRRAGGLRPGAQLGDPQRFRQPREEVRMGGVDDPVAAGDKGDEIFRLDLVLVEEDAPAHAVEHDVGEVAGVGERAPARLQAIRAGDEVLQGGRAGLDVARDLGEQPGPVATQAAGEADDISAVLAYLGDQMPGLLGAGREREGGVDEVGAPLAARLGFERDALAGTEAVELGR